MNIPDIKYDGTPEDLARFLTWLKSVFISWPEIKCPPAKPKCNREFVRADHTWYQCGKTPVVTSEFGTGHGGCQMCADCLAEFPKYEKYRLPATEQVQIAELRHQLAHTLSLYGRTWETLDAVVRCSIQGETDVCLICEADPDRRHTEDCPILAAEKVLNHTDRQKA